MQTPYTSWLIPLAASRWFNEAVYHRELMALPFRDIFVTDYGMEKTIVVEAPPRMLTIAAIWMALTMAVMIYKRWQ